MGGSIFVNLHFVCHMSITWRIVHITWKNLPKLRMIFDKPASSIHEEWQKLSTCTSVMAENKLSWMLYFKKQLVTPGDDVFIFRNFSGNFFYTKCHFSCRKNSNLVVIRPFACTCNYFRKRLKRSMINIFPSLSWAKIVTFNFK